MVSPTPTPHIVINTAKTADAVWAVVILAVLFLIIWSAGMLITAARDAVRRKRGR